MTSLPSKIIPLFAILALLVSCSKPPEQTPEEEKESGQVAAPPDSHEAEAPRVEALSTMENEKAPCESEEETLWALDSDGAWVPRCLNAPLPRDSAVWASDGVRLMSLGPQGCTPKPLPLYLNHLESGKVSRMETGHSSYSITRSASAAFDSEGGFHAFSAECCEKPTNYGLHFKENDGTSQLEHLSIYTMWPVVFGREEEVLVSGGLELREGELDVATGGGLHFKSAPFCWFLHPGESQKYDFPIFCGRAKGELLREVKKRGTWFSRQPVKGVDVLPPGRELSFVYDPKNDRLVSLGFFEPNLWISSEMDPTPLLWRVDRRAWSIPKEGAPSELPRPPVVGDGVTLLWDPGEERVILLDPFGEKSWLLDEENGAWAPWRAHDPLTPISGRSLPANTRTPTQRFTQWWAPYFAYWDIEKEAPVVVFYDDPHSLCLPVEGLEETYACPKGHP